MDFRTILAFVLMGLIYVYFFGQPPEPIEESQQAQRQSEQIQQTPSDAGGPALQSKKTQPGKQPAKSEAATDRLKTQNFKFENDRIEINLNALGEVQNFTLKDYQTKPDSDDNVTWIFTDVNGFNIQSLDSTMGRPSWSLKSAEHNKIELLARLGSVEFLRSISLAEDSYSLDFKDEIINQSDRLVDVRLSTRLSKKVADDKKERSFINPYGDLQEMVWYESNSLEKRTYQEFQKKKAEEKTVTGQISWSGFSTRYFFMGLVPINASLAEVQLESPNNDVLAERIEFRRKQVEPAARSSFEYKYYLGPKKKEYLKKAEPSLQFVIDYWTLLSFMTEPISRFLLSVMLMFYGLVPNYGVAIVLLTFLVKLALLPLAWKASVGMKKMAKIQPQLKDLRDKYKKDPQRMQMETARLFREEKVNPVGGCLPMLLQIPVFFALYPVFLVSIEMRHAPFFGWLSDLSARDPWFILPVALTALMWAQQKIMPMPTPAGGEENEAIKIQKAMFKVMPVMMGAFSLFMPAGLSLYILINVLFSVIQQYLFNKKLEVMFPQPNNGSALKVSNGN